MMIRFLSVRNALYTLAILLPASVLAQAPTTASSQGKSFRQIVETSILPLGDMFAWILYLLAFLVFLYGMMKFFFTGGEEGRTKGKQLMFWGIIALAVLFAVWGVVGLFLSLLTSWSV